MWYSKKLMALRMYGGVCLRLLPQVYEVRAGCKGVRVGRSTLGNMPSWNTSLPFMYVVCCALQARRPSGGHDGAGHGAARAGRRHHPRRSRPPTQGPPPNPRTTAKGTAGLLSSSSSSVLLSMSPAMYADCLSPTSWCIIVKSSSNYNSLTRIQ